jgi:AraC-like DNA-binding protein
MDSYLIDTDMKISEICYTTGFKSLSYFNRRFREAHQCSPRKWRKQRRDAQFTSTQTQPAMQTN